MIKNLVPREYQKNIAESALKKNTLVVLPTGTGKTIIAILVAVKRIKKYPDSQVMILAPTRPLAAQHKHMFEKFTILKPEEIALVTGRVKPSKRKEIYRISKIVSATPQTIKNDLMEGRLSFSNFSLLVFDEAHRAVKDYPYPFIAKRYMLQSSHPLILALTASPGATKERIREIMKNLFIKNIEVRSEWDRDVKPYVKRVKREYVYVNFPKELEDVRENLYSLLDEILEWLKEHRFISSKRMPKKELIKTQKNVAAAYARGEKNPINIWGMIRLSQAVKIFHAIEIMETQEIEFLYEYLKKILSSKKRVDKMLAKDQRIIKSYAKVKELIEKGYEHPKMNVLTRLVKKLLSEDPTVRIIVFANYRSTVEKITKKLLNNNILAHVFIGQAKKGGKGMNQKEQLETIEKFRKREFNVLVATSVGEEGLDIPAVEYVIFYEPVPSEIRTIQRRGRVGRQTVGKVFFLITKGTMDESYFFASLHKERKMRKILKNVKKVGLEEKKNLLDWTKAD